MREDHCAVWEKMRANADKSVKPSKPYMHSKICEELNATYIAKNNDYGDSFAQLRKRQPNAILVRLFDKYLRLETLLQGEAAMVAESIDDTLLDMANYCIMEAVERMMERDAVAGEVQTEGPMTRCRDGVLRPY